MEPPSTFSYEGIRCKLRGSFKDDNFTNSNIIYANNNEDLGVENLYDILLENGITSNTAYDFITRKLWPNDTSKELQLKLRIKNKQGMLKMESENLKFKNHMVTFYIIFIVFIILILFNLK